MNILKVKEQSGGNSLQVTFDNNSVVTCPKVNSNIEYEMVKEWLAKGGVIEDEFTPEELEAQAEAVAKVVRTQELANLTVEVNGHVFDANETARTNMMAAILSAELIGKTEESWKLADNSVVLVTLAQLKEALALAIQAVGEIVKG